MTPDLTDAVEAAAGHAFALEEAIGHSDAYFEAWPDAYTFTGADGTTSYTFDAGQCTFASSSHGDDHVVACKTCAWRERYGNLPKDPCLMYVVPPLCPVCRAHGDVSGVRSHYPRDSSKPHDAGAGRLITDGGEEGDCPADGCDGTLEFARRRPNVAEYDCDTCDTTVPYYPEGEA